MRPADRAILLVTLVATLIACSGCATAPNNSRCLAGRPSWHYHEGPAIRATKAAAAKRWDRQCTVVGVVGSAAAGR
jgi:hypothetical protein